VGQSGGAQPAAVSSSTLASGREYRFIASGVVDVGFDNGDAEFYAPVATFEQDLVGGIDFGISVNSHTPSGSKSQWRSIDGQVSTLQETEHSYFYDFTGTGAAATFSFFDDDYSDNVVFNSANPNTYLVVRIYVEGSTGSALPAIPGTDTVLTRPADGADGSQDEGMGISDAGVRYMDGALSWTANDFASEGFGTPWAQSRTWSSLDGFYNTNVSHNGKNWFNAYLPYLAQVSSGSDNTIAVITNGTSAEYFDVDTVNNTETTYVGRYFNQNILKHDSSTDTFTLIDTTGHQVEFGDFSLPNTRQQGQFKLYKDQYNNVTEVATLGGYDVSGRILIIERSSGGGGTLMKETFEFTYSGDLVTSVKLNHIRSGGSPQQVREVEYTYYDGISDTLNGLADDLKTVTVNDQNDNAFSSSYYRYYVDGGKEHKLKYVLEGPSYARADAASGSWTPITGTDGNIDDYADAFFDYSGGRVSLARLAGTGSSSAANVGRADYVYSYDTPQNTGGYNAWNYKTTEQRLDPSSSVIDTNVVYTNEVGQVLLKKFSDASHTWITYNEYSSQGSLLRIATPSAMKTSSGTATAVLTDGGTTFYVKDDKGLVYRYGFEYADSSATIGMRFSGFASGTYLLHGYLDTGVQISDQTYEKHTDPGSGIDVYNIKTDVKFPSGSARTIEYIYDYHSGSNGIRGVTIAYPLAGSNAPTDRGDRESKIYDTYGRLTWRRDGDGYIRRTSYDDLTGAGATAVKNVDTSTLNDSLISLNVSSLTVVGTSDEAIATTSVDHNLVEGDWIRISGVTPSVYNGLFQVLSVVNSTQFKYKMSSTTASSGSGTIASYWGTPTGAGIPLTTTTVVDELGRPRSVTDPRGNTTYVRYDDPSHESRVYTAWDTTTHTTVGPTIVRREDWDSGYVEKFKMSPVLSGSNWDASNLPLGNESPSSLETLYREYQNVAGQIETVDRYFDLSGVTYSTSTHIGTINTNYYQTGLAYDTLGRNNSVIRPTQTVESTTIDSLGRVTSESVGVSGSMDVVASYEYDYPGDTLAGDGVGNSNLTRMTVYVDSNSANDRVTSFIYDWRDRAVLRKEGVQTSEADNNAHPITYIQYNNADQVTMVERYDSEYTISSTVYHLAFAYDSDQIPDQPSDPGVDTLSGNQQLISKETYDYDDRKRLYQKSNYSVDPASGAVGYPLSTNYWYNRRGAVLKVEQPGGLIAKTAYDGAGRKVKISYSDGGLEDHAWDNADEVDGDRVVEQVELTYDENGNLILATQRQRFHDQLDGNPSGGDDLGELGTLSSTHNKARVSYTSYYYDAANRATKKVVVGTNGGSSYSRPTSESDSDNNRGPTRIVTTYGYNAAGQMEWLTNPRNIANKTEYDDAGRVIKTIQGYNDSTPSAGDDQTLQYTYDGSDHVRTYQATLPSSGVQVTEYVYGETTFNLNASSGITQAGAFATATTTTAHNLKVGETVVITGASVSYYNAKWVITAVPTSTTFKFGILGSPGTSNGGTARRDTDTYSKDVLVGVKYPDKSSGSASASEMQTFSVNRIGERKTLADRNGNVHTYTYDLLGRMTDDAATTLGAGVYSGNRRRSFTFNQELRPEYFRTYSSPSGGTQVTQVRREYNGFGQVTKEAQTWLSSLTKNVLYSYEDRHGFLGGAGNTSRLASVTYPDGRVIEYEYWGGTEAGGIDNAISRVSFVKDNDSVASSNGPVNGPILISDVSAPSDLSDGTHLEEYNYLGLNTVVRRNRPEPGTELTYIDTVTGDAGDQYVGLDRFDRIVDQRWNDTSGNDRFKYGYDENGNVLYRDNVITDSLSGASDLDELYHADGSGNGYDKLDRLTEFQRGKLNGGNDTVSTAARTQVWTLDATGNWTSINTNGTSTSRSYNKQNQITTFTYDKNGNLTKEGSGILLTAYTYDAWNQLSSTGNGDGHTYRYDALGRRVYDQNQNAFNSPTSHLYYTIDWRQIEDDHKVTAAHSITDTVLQNVWSPHYIDEMILRDSVTTVDEGGGDQLLGDSEFMDSGTLEEEKWSPEEEESRGIDGGGTTDFVAGSSVPDGRLYVQQDANYNVTSLTDISGDVVERYMYDPYGTPTVMNASWTTGSSAYGWEYMLQGLKNDGINNFYYARNRDMHATYGVFIEQDPNPAGQYNDGANLYQMERSNPLNTLDALGLTTGPTLPQPIEEGGYTIDHNFGGMQGGQGIQEEHGPPHLEITGNGEPKVRIGQAGNPIRSQDTLTRGQRRAIANVLSEIRSAVDKIARWHRYYNRQSLKPPEWAKATRAHTNTAARKGMRWGPLAVAGALAAGDWWPGYFDIQAELSGLYTNRPKLGIEIDIKGPHEKLIETSDGWRFLRIVSPSSGTVAQGTTIPPTTPANASPRDLEDGRFLLEGEYFDYKGDQ
jgi:RHS repeat-associated protein